MQLSEVHVNDFPTGHCHRLAQRLLLPFETTLTFNSDVGNSPVKLHHTRSVAYSVELVVLNKRQISSSGAYLNCYPVSNSFQYHSNASFKRRINGISVV